MTDILTQDSDCFIYFCLLNKFKPKDIAASVLALVGTRFFYGSHFVRLVENKNEGR